MPRMSKSVLIQIQGVLTLVAVVAAALGGWAVSLVAISLMLLVLTVAVFSVAPPSVSAPATQLGTESDLSARFDTLATRVISSQERTRTELLAQINPQQDHHNPS